MYVVATNVAICRVCGWLADAMSELYSIYTHTTTATIGRICMYIFFTLV